MCWSIYWCPGKLGFDAEIRHHSTLLNSELNTVNVLSSNNEIDPSEKSFVKLHFVRNEQNSGEK